MDRQRAATVLVIAVAALGALTVAAALLTFDARIVDPAFYLLLVALAALAQRVPVPLFRSGAVSVAFAPAITAYVLYGAAAAVWVTAASAAVVAVTPRRKPLHKIVYNVGALCGSAYAAGQVYGLVASAVPLTGIAATFVAVALSALVYFTLNSGLVALAIAVTTGSRFAEVWRTNYAWTLVNYVAAASNGGALALAYTALGTVGAATFILPLFVAWYSFKLYMTKSREVRARNEELGEVNRQLHDTNRLLEHQALHDPLTELPNRVLLRDRIEQAIAAARRQRTGFALLLVDFDGFKAVNDTFGHDAGDELLVQIGHRLREGLRESDTIARLGGDEFAVLLPDTGAEGARQAALKLAASLEQPFAVQGHDISTEASVGISTFPEHGAGAEELLRRADVAMYVAKRTHSTYAVYAPEHDEHSPDRLAVLTELRRAIREGELFLRYQPIVQLDSRRIESAEALVRWDHPRRGVLGPMEFVPLAERTGLIKPLYEWVLNTALRDARSWSSGGEPVTVSVNTSMRNLLDLDLPQTVASALAAADMRAQRLKLEITESVIMADPEQARATVATLRAMGVRVSIDDFGTGYSSLAYLQRLPVSEIKIDRSFVRAAATDPGSRAIVRATVDLGRTLGLQVVAEGVEDEETLEMLAQTGCDAAQGFLIAKPLPASELARMVARPAMRIPMPRFVAPVSLAG